MKNVVGVAAVISGILLVLVPRFILPSCEYAGYPAMHCSDTAHAEFAAGALLAITGVSTLVLKTRWAALAGAVSSLALFVVSFVLPDIFGYCRSSRMPCNYGMVPGVRFIAVVGGIIMLIAALGSVRASRRKGMA